MHNSALTASAAAMVLLFHFCEPAYGASPGSTISSGIGQNIILDAPDPDFPQTKSLHPGVQVQTWSMNPGGSCGGPEIRGTDNQLWWLSSDGHIVNKIANLVLDVRGIGAPVSDANLNTVRGTPVILWTENKPATPNQLWKVENDKIVSALNNNLVLDVAGNPAPGSAVGAKVIVWTANTPSTPNQIWHVFDNICLH